MGGGVDNEDKKEGRRWAEEKKFLGIGTLDIVN